MNYYPDWGQAAEAELADVIALRRAIHADPELGLACHRTAAKLRAALTGLPLEIHESTSTSSFIAILRGGAPGRTVLLRGDMDALPMPEETGLDFASRTLGMMHACGHDAHSAMLVGAVRALAARRETLAGTVVFMFQPGEEGHHGARFMIEDGLLDIAAPDAAFALHISPNMPFGTLVSRPGPLLAATDSPSAVIRGSGGHAAMPHDTIDPIPVACEAVMALQAFVARRVAVTDPAVLSITQVSGGFTHNIVPDTAEISGTLRTLSPATREVARAGFRRVVEGVAAAHGCTADVTIEPGYPVTMNDPRAIDVMRACATALGGEAAWHMLDAPIMGGEDFAYVLERVPGAMAFLGVAAPGSDHATNPPLHNTRMTIAEDAMARGVAMHCAVAERFLAEGWG